MAYPNITYMPSQSAMLAQPWATVGDMTYREDLDETFMLVAIPSSLINNWAQIAPGVGGGGGGLFSTLVTPNTSFSVLVTSSLYLVTTGSSAIVSLLPSAVGIARQTVMIKKIDSGSGMVVVTPINSQTIDGLAAYTLVQQDQYLGVVSDGANWQIFTRN